MRLYIYKGLDEEEVPKDVTHVIVDDSIIIIKERTFEDICPHLVSIIMGDNVKRIETKAFLIAVILLSCPSTRLEYIGYRAFWGYSLLEALFLPSSVKPWSNIRELSIIEIIDSTTCH
eukprot:526689_1